MEIKYPNITVKLTDEDGNAVAIVNRVASAMRKAGVPAEEIAAFRSEAFSGNYDHLLQTCMRWVECD